MFFRAISSSYLIGIVPSRMSFFFGGARRVALSPCGRGHHRCRRHTRLGVASAGTVLADRPPHPALHATFSPPKSGLPELGLINLSKSDKSDFDGRREEFKP